MQRDCFKNLAMICVLSAGFGCAADSVAHERAIDEAQQTSGPSAPPAGAVSRPGAYSGYAEKLYDGYQLSSQYVQVRDGTKLAVDLYRPKGRDGRVVSTPLPVLWMHSPYNRRTYGAGVAGETYPGYAARLVDYGYVVAIADFRGLYASYGKNQGFNRGEWVDAARYDAYDITEWLAKQPFSTGKVGMWGCSATGGSQMQAATTAPPSLKAIFPMSCEFDVYPFGVPGGMSAARGDTKAPPGGSSSALRDRTAAPVDGASGRTQLSEAQRSHAGSVENPGYVPFRDSVAANIPEKWWIKSSPHTYLDALQKANVAVYAAANWDEAGTKYGAAFTYNNLENAKLIFGPGTHCAWTDVKNTTGFDIVIEERRFFDYWLKGIQNGVMTEPGVTYYTYNAPRGKEWTSVSAWPLPSEKRIPYYLGAKTLGTELPADGKDTITVDYAATPARPALGYETPALAADVTVTGHPLVDLWLSSTATDSDVVVTLQDVAPSGTVSSYNMHGRLRASLRKEAEAPYDNLGLPFHPSHEADAQPLTPGEPTRLRFDLLPISIIFKKGHRIRVAVTFADTPTPRLRPAPTVTVYRDAAHPSAVVLPIVAEGAAENRSQP
ncbi:MAG: CocE/NonD family hydrolase [Polyangiales bacterium]